MVRVATHRPPTHPGEMLLEEFLVPMGVTRWDLASAIHVPYQRVNELAVRQRAHARASPGATDKLQQVCRQHDDQAAAGLLGGMPAVAGHQYRLAGGCDLQERQVARSGKARARGAAGVRRPLARSNANTSAAAGGSMRSSGRCRTSAYSPKMRSSKHTSIAPARRRSTTRPHVPSGVIRPETRTFVSSTTLTA